MSQPDLTRLVDEPAFEDFDADAAAERDLGMVALNQLAMRHLIG